MISIKLDPNDLHAISKLANREVTYYMKKVHGDIDKVIVIANGLLGETLADLMSDETEMPGARGPESPAGKGESHESTAKKHFILREQRGSRGGAWRRLIVLSQDDIGERWLVGAPPHNITAKDMSTGALAFPRVPGRYHSPSGNWWYGHEARHPGYASKSEQAQSAVRDLVQRVMEQIVVAPRVG